MPLQYPAQTSDTHLQLNIEKAEGIYIFNTQGKSYIDLTSGISVSNIGHCHPKVVEAVKNQAEKYMHIMVYGKYIQAPQIEYAKLLTAHLPAELNCPFFVNSGTEAVEGALKLAKCFTRRSEIIAFKNAYHGSTHGALSLLSDETFKRPFRPLLPDIRLLEFNNTDGLENISEKTACVIVEPIQGEAGIILPENNFLKKLREKCNETGTLLIFDEIQTGFGRTGTLFAFQSQSIGIIPDILIIAKAMGGGMPLGAFVSSKKIMDSLKTNNIPGHLTTFGGHPVSCAAAYASLKVLLDENLISQVKRKGELFKKYLVHPAIKEIRGVGLLLAVETRSSSSLHNSQQIQKVISCAVKKGVIIDTFLFAAHCFRIAPPLIITDEEIKMVCDILNDAIENSMK